MGHRFSLPSHPNIRGWPPIAGSRFSYASRDSCGIWWEWGSRYAIQDPLWMLAHTSRFTKASTLQCVETLTWSVGLWYRCVCMYMYVALDMYTCQWIFVCVSHVEDTVTMIKVGKSWSSRAWQVGWLVFCLCNLEPVVIWRKAGGRAHKPISSLSLEMSDMAFLHRLHPFKSPWHLVAPGGTFVTYLSPGASVQLVGGFWSD